MFNLRYWGYVHEWATKINSDGCTVVKDWYLACCEEHDIHYRFARRINDVTGELDQPITYEQANKRLGDCIRSRSKLKWFQPLAYARWFGTQCFGWPIWNKYRERERLEKLNGK